MKKTKIGSRLSGTTLAIVILSVLLASTVAIGILLAYFSSNGTGLDNISNGDIINISITQDGSSASSLTLSSGAIPGTILNQAINIHSPSDLSNAIVRAKLTISNNNGKTTNVEAKTSDDWVLHSDNYYYYKGVVSNNQSIPFVEKITIPTSLSISESNQPFNIDIIVESIPELIYARNHVWISSPRVLLDKYSLKNY